MEAWQKNLFPIVVVQAIMMVAFSSMSPFMAPFITELGIVDPQAVKIWAGFLTSINALFAAILSPYWGSLSDRYGRKIMVVRSTMSIGVLLTLLTVHEDFQPAAAAPDGNKKVRSRSPLATFRLFPVVAAMFVVLFLTQFSVRSVEPIMALYVEEIGAATTSLNTLIGAVFAVTGLTQTAGLLVVGHLSNALGYRKLLLITLLGSGLLYLPQALVTNVGQLMLLRALFGFFLGGILPMANAIIGAMAPQDIKGQIFGLTSSATFLGNFAGPTLGGIVSAYFGIPAVFILTACLLLVNAWLVWRRIPREGPSQVVS
ncbi:MAG: MFS transporter [Clostridia bacterium]|nr:MAG: MFS transporter [Clostridia bacterium]